MRSCRISIEGRGRSRTFDFSSAYLCFRCWESNSIDNEESFVILLNVALSSSGGMATGAAVAAAIAAAAIACAASDGSVPGAIATFAAATAASATGPTMSSPPSPSSRKMSSLRLSKFNSFLLSDTPYIQIQYSRVIVVNFDEY